MAILVRLGLVRARYSKARARLRLEKNGLVPPLLETLRDLKNLWIEDDQVNVIFTLRKYLFSLVLLKIVSHYCVMLSLSLEH